MQRISLRTTFTFLVLSLLIPSLMLAGTPPTGDCLVGTPPANATILDLLILIPPDLFGLEAEILTWLTPQIDDANTVFANSEIDAFYCLRACEPVMAEDLSFCNPGELGCQATTPIWAATGRDWLNQEADEVLDLRNQHGADFVVLLTPQNPQADPVCGQANLVERGLEEEIFNSGDDSLPFRGRAYSTLVFDPNGVRCPAGALTLAHELGHNFGLIHNNDFSTNPLVAWGRGFLIDIPGAPTSQLATLMGCNFGTHPTCDHRIPYFSDDKREIDPDVPDAKWVGIGDASHNSSDAIRSRLPIAEHYAEPPGADAPPWIRFQLPDLAMALENTPLTARVGDPPPVDPGCHASQVVEWSYGSSGLVIDEGQEIAANFHLSGQQTIVATVSDACLQEAEWSDELLICWPPDEYEGNSDDVNALTTRTLESTITEHNHNFHFGRDTPCVDSPLYPDRDWMKVRTERNGLPVKGTLIAVARRRGANASDVRIEILPSNSGCTSLGSLTPLSDGINRAAHRVMGNKCYFIRFQNDDEDLWGHDTNHTQRVFLDTPPQADFVVSCTGTTCDFDASGSTDDRGPLSYNWSFGDGTAATGSEVSHNYSAGSFTATLTVIDQEAQADSASRTLIFGAPVVTPEPGLWANPNRSGTGLSFVEHTPGNYALAWYTYDATGRPTWYLSGVGPQIGNQAWQQPLYRSHWDGATAQSTEVGWVELVTTGSSTAATMRWELDGTLGSEPVQLFGPSMDRAGAWVDPSEDGWAIEIEESANHLAAYVLFYDSDGEPIWTLGTGSAAASGWQGLPMVIFDGAGLCPSCTGGSSTPPPSQGAGAINLNIAAGASSGQAALQITTPFGNWIRGTIPIDRLTLP